MNMDSKQVPLHERLAGYARAKKITAEYGEFEHGNVLPSDLAEAAHLLEPPGAKPEERLQSEGDMVRESPVEGLVERLQGIREHVSELALRRFHEEDAVVVDTPTTMLANIATRVADNDGELQQAIAALSTQAAELEMLREKVGELERERRSLQGSVKTVIVNGERKNGRWVADLPCDWAPMEDLVQFTRAALGGKE